MKLQYKDKSAGKKQIYADLLKIASESLIELGYTDYGVTPYEVFYHDGEIVFDTYGVTMVLRETGNYSYELAV